jgi:hypothetical protein
MLQQVTGPTRADTTATRRSANIALCSDDLDSAQSLRQNIPQMGEIKSDATCRGRTRRRRQMKENRRATVANRRAVVPSQYPYHVIDGIGAPEFFMPPGIGQANRPIIGAVARIVAPAVIRADRLDRAGSARRRNTIGPIQHPPQRQNTRRCREIALHLQAADASPAETSGVALRTEPQKPIWRQNCLDHIPTVERACHALKRPARPKRSNSSKVLLRNKVTFPV